MPEASMLELSEGEKVRVHSIVAEYQQGNGGYGIQRSVDDIVFIVHIIHTGNIGRIADYLLLASIL